MRRIRGLAVFAAALSLLPGSSRAIAASGAADSTAASSGDASDSTGWLPSPEEDFESLEPFQESAQTAAGWMARAAVTKGVLRMRRVAANLGARGELGLLFDGTRVRPGARIASRAAGGVAIAAGRVSLARLPPLLADATGLTRAGRRVIAPRAGAFEAAPSRGESPAALDGGAFMLGARRRRGMTLDAFAGARADSREVVGGAGFGYARGGTRALAMLAAAGREQSASLTGIRQARGSRESLELFEGTRGRALLGEIVSHSDGATLSARWRYRSWMARPVAAEIEAVTQGAGARARVTWRSWSSGATEDDGLLEVEGSILPVRVRIGASGSREGYGMVEAVLAREPGRSLSVHALSASSTTVGGRIDLRGRAGTHALLLESTRLRRGAAAWGVVLEPSGATTLRSRTNAGLLLAARGSVGGGGWRIGYAMERGEDGSGPKPWSGSLWLRR